MFLTARGRVSSAGRLWGTLIPSIVVVTALFAVSPASAQVVGQYDFESSAQGWTAFFGATVAVSGAAAESGTHSLLATTSASGTGGPSLSVTGLLLPGAKYQITGWVMLAAGETATASNFTIARSDPSCS